LSEIEKRHRHRLEPHALAAGTIDGNVDISRLFAHMGTRGHQGLAHSPSVFEMPAAGPLCAGLSATVLGPA
jgi:hypothetical protein